MENNYTNLTPQEEAELFSQVDTNLVDTLRFVLLHEERKKREELLTEIEQQKQHIAVLETKFNTLENTMFDTSELTTTIEKVVVVALRRQIKGDREQMARTISPIIGDALRIQLRENKADISDALHPVIGNNVSRSVRQSLRRIQNEIDKRLHSGRNFIASIKARLSGITPGQLTLRDSLPFTVKQVFLIQQDSGLLLSHYKSIPDDELPSGMVGGMLTAIRQFANDAFGNAEEDAVNLDEIHYGNERIIIEGQEFAYIAAVVDGTEPVKFRDDMLDFVSDLHIDYRNEIRDYNGGFDPTLEKEIEEQLTQFATIPEESATVNISPLTMTLSLGLLVAAIASILFLAFFILRLLPYLFISPPTSPPPTTTEPIIMCIDCALIASAEPSPLRIGAVVYDWPNGIQTGALEAGTIVSVINTSGDWVRVAWHDDKTPTLDLGWIRKSFIQQQHLRSRNLP